MRTIAPFAILVIAACFVSDSNAAEPITLAPITLASVTPMPPIAPDEALSKVISLERTARYLDAAALDWQKRHACTACHTMFPYLMARSALSSFGPQSAEVRKFFEEIVGGKREAMPSYSCKDVGGAVAVGVATAMSINDRYTSKRLHPLTRQALDQMWKLQRPDGGWEWPFRDTPPLKINEHYGVTLAAIGTGMAPEDYAKSPQAIAGLHGIRQFLQRTKPVGLHQRAMMLWASVYVDGILSDPAKVEILSKLMSVQRPDGGWSLASLVDNTDDTLLKGSDRIAEARAQPGYGTEFLTYLGRDAEYKSSLKSDGYATGFVVFVARQAGLTATDVRLRRGVAWLKSNQRESGRWFTPSQAWHSQNLISNAGTAYAVLALEACGEVPQTRHK